MFWYFSFPWEEYTERTKKRIFYFSIKHMLLLVHDHNHIYIYIYTHTHIYIYIYIYIHPWLLFSSIMNFNRKKKSIYYFKIALVILLVIWCLFYVHEKNVLSTHIPILESLVQKSSVVSCNTTEKSDYIQNNMKPWRRVTTRGNNETHTTWGNITKKR